MEYASKGTAGAALGTGIAGLALGVLNGAGGLLGMGMNGMGYNGWNNHPAGFNPYVTKDEMLLYQQIAAKDSELALVKSEQNTEIKIADVYERLAKRINDFEREQSVYNGVNTSTVSVLRNQVEQLMGLTALHIPASNVCPEPMPKYNSWTAPTAG